MSEEVGVRIVDRDFSAQLLPKMRSFLTLSNRKQAHFFQPKTAKTFIYQCFDI
ncbi:MAG: hypothetical protein F6K18_30655 [Okeania sp. SIO2C2]|uniref:hypothetical protein n=1 Tax=Okeania sp. SIO2C2 TaxID=2607787 RepID=UPI0013B83FF7|nr:hypothetical protein [Okeania sp. SIO2C2]NEP90819.1 hypothetical protein [Okeania sp. SIO2C2]NES67749.1 hypothetical protein [Okeania sp. SIO2D1]